MGVFPDSRLGKIEFYENHLEAWAANAAQIGLVPAAVSSLASLTGDARERYQLAEQARQAAKSATQAYYDAVRLMHSGPGNGADMVARIKNFAQSTNNPTVYTLAQIPPPADPSTVPPPGTPFDFVIGLLQSGALEIRFKCVNPTNSVGTIYEIRRKIGTSMSAPFEFVGATGARRFTDETLTAAAVTAGGGAVGYQITAVRSTTRGNPGQFTVSFGVGSGGGGFVLTGMQGVSMGEQQLSSSRLAA